MSKKRKGGKHALDDPFLDERSMELFGKPESLLQIREREILNDYIQDWLHPVWKLVETDKGDLVEVSNIGQVRDPETKELYKVYKYDGLYANIAIPASKSKTGKAYTQFVHRLVCKAFWENPENKRTVNHINGNKWCNWYKNLEWATDSENNQHAVKTGLRAIGEDCSFAKYSNNQIEQVCQLLQDRPDLTYEDISNITGVKTGTVVSVYRRQGWKNISEKYVFPPKTGARPHGEDASSNIYTADQIKQVCGLLQNRPNLTYKELSEFTGINPSVIASIYKKKIWKTIVNEYDFPPRDTKLIGTNKPSSKYTEEQIEEVCKLLDEKFKNPKVYSYQLISEITGVNDRVVRCIPEGRLWACVAKNHDFYKAKFENK